MPHLSIEVLERIFSDAYVLDIDLSHWDDFFGVVVVADHWRVPGPGQGLPILMVEFQDVSSFSVEFAHREAMKLARRSSTVDPPPHFQWHVYEIEVLRGGSPREYRFNGGPEDPKWTIRCEGESIVEIDPIALHRIYPGWSRPGRGFLRPGLLDALRAERHRRR